MEATEISLVNVPLERFLLLAKTAGSRAVAMTIEQAITAPDVHAFAELLDMANVQSLRGTPQEPSLRLLELFAYGTYPEYRAAANSLPPLNEQQLKKLRLLTIVSMGSEKKVLLYGDLMEALDVGTLRELEDLLIDGIYRKLIFGKMDQKNQLFTVDRVIGRDLKSGDLEKMAKLFVDWADNCKKVITTMDQEMTVANNAKSRDAAHEADIVQEIEKLKEAIKVAESDGKGSRQYNASEFASAEFNDEHHRNVRGGKRF